MTVRFPFLFVAAVVALFSFAILALSACSSDEGIQGTTASHTEGQALMDLKKARNAGAINHDEYEDQKEEILDRYDD